MQKAPTPSCIQRQIEEKAVNQWSGLVAFGAGNDTMMYPRTAYPHVTVDLNDCVRRTPTGGGSAGSWRVSELIAVEFTRMHYSRSADDAHRNGYVETSAGWLPQQLDESEGGRYQTEGDAAVDAFLAAIGSSKRVLRGKSNSEADNATEW